ncbi:MAG TPA: PQQ-dependent sugar dehydrogenase [Chloroflexota bacterium]|nr:PQQ-dependent sugar dehydrogenase [Chloroflexota bacterium]
MRTLLLAATLAASLAAPPPGPARVEAQDAGCRYVLGFLALYQQIPQAMGPCVEDETPAPNGDSLQRTANGLAVYRRADNWTAFTDGWQTWINGPNGVQRRLNSERFTWEADAGAAGVTTVPTPSAFDPATVTVSLEPAVRGFAAPLYATHAGDGSGRLYVVEKRGSIRLVDGGVASPAPFLNIQPLVRSSGSEQGLLGLAFHPRYSQNRHFYVNYTDTSGDTMIVRYTARADGTAADPESAQTLLHLDQPAANHNGGNLVFGPDGYLYIGMGDGGGGGDTYRNAQNPQALLGKMLRLDVDRAEGGRPYAIPPDNPFVGNPAFRAEIWALGLRNPWRYSFDRATGDLYIADVGQNAYEEIHFQPAGSRGGQNYGWPRMEGTHCYPSGGACDRAGLELPIAEYGRSEGCSVTGGYVYRGHAQPQLGGAYFFGDYCSGRIWSLHRDAGGSWVRTQLIDTDVQVSSFGEDESGELYVTGLSDGTLYRVVARPR